MDLFIIYYIFLTILKKVGIFKRCLYLLFMCGHPVMSWGDCNSMLSVYNLSQLKYLFQVVLDVSDMEIL